MGPESVIASSDPQASPNVIEYGPCCCCKAQLNKECSDTSQNRNNQNQGGVDPVDMTMPVLQRDRLLSDMHLLTTCLSC